MSCLKFEPMKEAQDQKQKQIVIIGGGITGLSAARHLDRHANGKYKVTLIEAGDVLGGQILTRKVSLETGDQLVLDGGVDWFDTQHPEVAMLAEELGLAGEVIPVGYPKMALFDNGQLIRLPSSVLEFIGSDLLTGQEKRRVLSEAFIPAKVGDEDESVSAFVTRRLGKTAYDKLVGPLLEGIFGSDLGPESVLTKFAELREMEERYGGVLKGAARRKRERTKRTRNPLQRTPYLRFAGGAQTLVDHLVKRLKLRIIRNTRAVQVTPTENRYQVVLSTGGVIEADAVLLATPAHVSAELLKVASPEASTLLSQILQETIVSVSLVFRSQDIQVPAEFNRLMFSQKEKRKISSVTWISGGEMGSVPKGYELFRVFFGRGAAEMTGLTEVQIARTALAELKEILGIVSQPVHTEVFRWADAYPRAELGHLELVELILEQLPAGIFLAGSSYRGMTVSDCIRQGTDSAEFSLQYVETL